MKLLYYVIVTLYRWPIFKLKKKLFSPLQSTWTWRT